MTGAGNREVDLSSAIRLQQHFREPYIGPRSFRREAEDQKRFFGRDEETDEIISLISSHKLVLVYAQSGAGKTSIFNAQVVPALERVGFEVLPMSRVRITFTGLTSSFTLKNLYIFNAIQSLKPKIDPMVLTDKSLTDFLADYFPNDIDDNGDVVPQVLVFDQLEELFSFSAKEWKEQQEGFFHQISEALDNNSLLRIVFLIREDHLAELDPFLSVLPEKLRPRFRLERLREEAAIAAIKGPLEKTNNLIHDSRGDEFNDEIRKLVKDLIKIRVEDPFGESHQTEGEFVEPIHLQVVCQRWWRERTNKTIKKSDNSLEDLTDVDNALKDFYTDAIREAINQSDVQESDLRKWCGNTLITSSGTRGIVHRDADSTAGMSNSAVDILEHKYLIRREWRAGATWYELTHDRLIEPIKDSNKEWLDKIEREE